MTQATKKIAAAGGLVLLLAVVAASVYFYTPARLATAPPGLIVGPTDASQAQDLHARDEIGLPVPRPVPAGLAEYRNAFYHFSVLYPFDLQVRERKEEGSAITVTFQNVITGHGFQVYIVPYAGKEVTRERFLQDVPSGVMASSSSILIDGVQGSAFYSSNALLGETYERWFIHHGFLYEVTTYAPLDAWLAEIMQTWLFY